MTANCGSSSPTALDRPAKPGNAVTARPWGSSARAKASPKSVAVLDQPQPVIAHRSPPLGARAHRAPLGRPALKPRPPARAAARRGPARQHGRGAGPERRRAQGHLHQHHRGDGALGAALGPWATSMSATSMSATPRAARGPGRTRWLHRPTTPSNTRIKPRASQASSGASMAAPPTHSTNSWAKAKIRRSHSSHCRARRGSPEVKASTLTGSAVGRRSLALAAALRGLCSFGSASGRAPGRTGPERRPGAG